MSRFLRVAQTVVHPAGDHEVLVPVHPAQGGNPILTVHQIDAITEFVKRFQSEISCYADEYYAPVFPALSPVQLRYLRQQMDTGVSWGGGGKVSSWGGVTGFARAGADRFGFFPSVMTDRRASVSSPPDRLIFLSCCAWTSEGVEWPLAIASVTICCSSGFR